MARHRRSRAAGAAHGPRRGVSRLDRQLGRPRRRRLPGIPDPLAGRLREHGVEGRGRRRSLFRRHAGQGPEGAVRVAGLCLRRLAAAWRRCTTSSASPTAPRRCAPRRNGCSIASTRRSGTRRAASTPIMLDGEKRKVLSVASNPGHLPVLRHRAARPRRPRRRAAHGAGHELRLGHPHAVGEASRVQPVLLSERLGLAARQRHHREGFKRYGFHAEAAAIARDIVARGGPFPAEPVAGAVFRRAARATADFPVQYLGANVPQAWAAGSVFMLLQAILGIQPDAPRGRMFVDPALPAWLPDITLTDLRVCGQRSSTSASGARTRRRVRGDCAATAQIVEASSSDPARRS